MTAPELPVDAAWSEEDESRRESFVVEAPEEGERLDRLLAERLSEISRSYAQSLIDDGYVAVDGRTRKASYRVHEGETLAVLLPPPAPSDPEPEAIPLTIVYEDSNVLVIDKPAGMVTHPAPGHEHGTVVNAVLAHAPEVHINGSIRPGIVHRLDKDTSGLLIVAKNERALAFLAAQFQERRTIKRYIALVDGEIDPEEGTIDVPIGRDPRARQRMAAIREGRESVSHFTVRERFVGHTLVDVRIETGRTHQIRVHMAFIGHPVTGDVVYGAARVAARLPLERQFLHAAELGLKLPNGVWHDFTAPLPTELEETLTILRAEVASEIPLA